MASAGTDARSAASEGVHAFVAEHSDLYKEQKDGDAAATVEGCLPPESTIPRERCVACLAALASLYIEFKSTSAANQSNPRVMRVRNNPLFESLRSLDTVEGLADLRTVTDYILLPKLLVEALELEAAVVEARTQYFAARATYDVATATTALPRLVDFLLRQEHEKLSEMLEATLAACRAQAQDVVRLSRDYERLTSTRGLTFQIYPRVLEPEAANDYRALVDGMTGESLSEYGYEPGDSRSLAYATGCLLAGQPVPFSAISSSSRLTSIQQPHLAALLVGSSADVLSEFQTRGFDFATKPDQLRISLAAQSGSRETLSWLYAQNPAAFMARGQEIFRTCVREGHIATARWLLEEFKFSAERPEQGIYYGWGDLCAAAATRNDFDTVKWLHLELGYHMTTAVATHACRHGNREMLEFCLEKRDPRFKFDFLDAIRAALEGGHRGLAVWLLEGEGKAKKIEEYGIAEDGTRFLDSACEGFKGDVEVLEAVMTVSGGDDWSRFDLILEYVIKAAARHGDTGALEWVATCLRAEAEARLGRPFSEDEVRNVFLRAIEGAIEGNRADSARWLVKQALTEGVVPGQKMGKRALRALEDDIKLPSIELLEVLAPYFDFAFLYPQATREAAFDTLRWLGKNGSKLLPEMGFRLLRMLLEATGYAGEQAIPIIRCLREHCGLDIRAVKQVADSWTSVNILDGSMDDEEQCRRDRRFYREHKSAAFSLMAARSGDFARVEFVRRELDMPISVDTIREAAERGHLPLCRRLWAFLEPVYPWPERIPYYAQSFGSNETAAWAKEQDAKEEERKAKHESVRSASPPIAGVLYDRPLAVAAHRLVSL